jgi:fatty acid desaturase
VWSGTADKDPTARNVLRWRTQKRLPWIVRAAWRTWIPLSALAQHFVFWSYPLVLLRESREKMRECLISVLLLPVTYLALYLLWPEVFHPRNFALAFVIYLFAEELVNAPHHLDLVHFHERLPLWEQWRAARSCYYPPLVSELLVLNFNFHVEHHLYPALPWYRLRRARRLVRPAVGDGYHESTGISWNLTNRSRDIQRMIIGD